MPPLTLSCVQLLHTMKVPLSKLVATLQCHPDITDYLSIDQCIAFLNLIQLIKPTLLLALPPGVPGPLERLPLSAHEFIRASLGLTHETMKLVWHVLRDIAWDSLDLDEADRSNLGRQYLRSFLDHGPSNGIGMQYYCTVRLSGLNTPNSLLPPFTTAQRASLYRP